MIDSLAVGFATQMRPTVPARETRMFPGFTELLKL